MTPAATHDARRWSPLWGVWLGIALALIYLPVTLAVRNACHVPVPNATPRELRTNPVEVASSYWVTWGISLVVLMVPGLILALAQRARRVAIGYIATAGIIGILLCVAMIGFELGGFAPT